MENQKNPNFLDDLVRSSISEIRELAESNTIVGDPILSPSGSVIIPISKVTVGYVVGGGEFNSVNKKLPYPSYGGSGGGVSVIPIGFIVETEAAIKFIDIENKTMYQTIINMINSLINKAGESEENHEED